MKRTTTFKNTLTLFFLFFLSFQAHSQWGDTLNFPNDTVEFVLLFGIEEPDSINKKISLLGGKGVDTTEIIGYGTLIKCQITQFPDTSIMPTQIYTLSELIHLIDTLERDCGSSIYGTGGSKGAKIRASNFNSNLTTVGNPINPSGNNPYDVLNYQPYQKCNLGFPVTNPYLEPCYNKISIAVFDSGLDTTNSLFGGLIQNPKNKNYTDTLNPSDISDAGIIQHGSKVTSIIQGIVKNDLINFEITNYKVLNDSKVGELYFLLKAIIESLEHQPNIMHLSLGTFICPEDTCSVVLDNILQIASNNNTLIVAAAGNDSTNVDNFHYIPSSLQIPNMIVVGGSDCWDDPLDFSNHGVKSVDLFAPGEDILTPYGLVTGTSFAAPIVTGVLAKIAALSSNFNAAALKAEALNTVNVSSSLNGFCKTSGFFDPMEILKDPCTSTLCTTIEENIIAQKICQIEAECKVKLGISNILSCCIESIIWESTDGSFYSDEFIPGIIYLPYGTSDIRCTINLINGESCVFLREIICENQQSSEEARQLSEDILYGHFGGSTSDPCTYNVHFPDYGAHFSAAICWDATIGFENIPIGSNIKHTYATGGLKGVCVMVSSMEESTCWTSCQEIDIDGDRCLQDLLIFEEADGDIKTQEKKIGPNKIQDSSTVGFLSGEEIILKPGFQIAPNPTKNLTNLTFDLALDTPVSLCLYTLDGNKSYCLLNNIFYKKGNHTIPLSTQKLGQGVFFISLVTKNKRITKRLVVLK